MTIDISGDVIYFDGRPVGFITVPNGSLRGEFEEALETCGYDESLAQELDDEKNARDELEDRINESLKYLDDAENVSIAELIKILS